MNELKEKKGTTRRWEYANTSEYKFDWVEVSNNFHFVKLDQRNETKKQTLRKWGNLTKGNSPLKGSEGSPREIAKVSVPLWEAKLLLIDVRTRAFIAIIPVRTPIISKVSSEIRTALQTLKIIKIFISIYCFKILLIVYFHLFI